MGQKLRVVHHSQVEFCLKSVSDHWKVLWKIEIFLKTSKWCATLTFGVIIAHVKINFGPENQGCTPFTGGVLLKICLRSF